MECWILALPLILIFLLIVALALFCFKRWKLAFVVFLLACGVNFYGEIFALHPFGGSSCQTEEKEVKVMTINVNGPGKDFDKRLNRIFDLIKNENPDILFLSEMSTPYKHYDMQLDSLLRLSFPYSTYKGQTQWGNVFYSKYPMDLSDMLSITLGKSQPLVSVDVKGIRMSLLGTHLSSNNYVDGKTKMEIDSVVTNGDAKLYLKTIEKGYRSRRQDVDTICMQLDDKEKARLIVLGDMNDVGGSYSIRKLNSLGLYDSWWKGGFGLGGTRNVLGFPFRIDHILYGEGFELKDVRVIETNGLSDHNAMVASFGM